MTTSDAQIDTADTVFHEPSGETWLVAGVKEGRLMWCGWPPGYADVANCRLVEKATPEKRRQLLQDLSQMQGDDTRKLHALRVLEQEAS